MNQPNGVRIESLEARRLLSAELRGDVLIVEGTSDGDLIGITSRDGGTTLRVTVNGERAYFAAADIGEIDVYGYRGSDDIEIENSVVAIDAMIEGAKGDDTLLGGGGNDSIYGNTGTTRSWAGTGTTGCSGWRGSTICSARRGTTRSWAGRAMT